MRAEDAALARISSLVNDSTTRVVDKIFLAKKKKEKKLICSNVSAALRRERLFSPAGPNDNYTQEENAEETAEEKTEEKAEEKAEEEE